MKPVIGLLPMDDRPVNYDYPTYLARLAGYELHLPTREWLGNPWRDSQHIRLIDWLVKEADSADVLIIALDTLAYGGLIPSRTSREPLDSVLERLSVLKKIKAKRSQLPILASSVILRISRANSSEEEKDYWATYGSAMFRLSYLGIRSTWEKPLSMSRGRGLSSPVTFQVMFMMIIGLADSATIWSISG